MATNLQFIKSYSGTDVASLSAEDCFTSSYDVYSIVFTRLLHDGSSVLMQFLDSSNTAITSSTYDYAHLIMKSYSGFAEHRATGQSSAWVLAYATNTYEKQFGAQMNIFNPNDSSSYTFSQYQSAGFVSSNMDNYKGIVVEKTAQQVKGIKFLNVGSATYDEIEFSVYGVK